MVIIADRCSGRVNNIGREWPRDRARYVSPRPADVRRTRLWRCAARAVCFVQFSYQRCVGTGSAPADPHRIPRINAAPPEPFSMFLRQLRNLIEYLDSTAACYLQGCGGCHDMCFARALLATLETAWSTTWPAVPARTTAAHTVSNRGARPTVLETVSE
jgi:hypothetical protein